MIFSLFWNGWSLSSELRVFLWKKKTYQCLEDVLMIHMVASIPRKRSEALVIFGNRASHHTCCSCRNRPLLPLWVVAPGWCGRAEALGLARPAFRVAALPSSVTWANQIIGFPEACVYLGTIRLCTRVFL